ncbi:MAG: 2-phosphosulfolactate phosphatase [Bacteroidetes bacterium]|nr:2-phosphosulfolactate phosphatase [Bacteroidota bacterium]
MEKRRLHVCLTPALLPTFRVEEYVVVVIDILRATTSMCVAFGHKVASIVPVETVDECAAWKERGYLGAAERNGEMIPGFDFGNSPFSYMRDDIAGKHIAMTTTNGTQALHQAHRLGAQQIIIGAFSNMSVLNEYLLSVEQHVLLLCSGWKQRLNMEDTIFAGAIARTIGGQFDAMDDAAQVARTFYWSANLQKRRFFERSSHYNRLVHLNLQNDVKYCLQRDTQAVLPMYRDGRILDALAPNYTSLLSEPVIAS